MYLLNNIPSPDDNIVVFDGALDDLKDYFAICAMKHKNCSVIACTSYAGGHYNTETLSLLKFRMFHMSSWTYEEYDNARGAGVINFSVEELKERYFYGGGSFRYVMLDPEILLQSIAASMATVNNYSLLLNGLQGCGVQSAVNSLMSCFSGGRKCTVSQYVTRLLSDKVSMDFVVIARNALPANPVLQGWVFDLEFFVRCHMGGVTLNRAGGGTLSWDHSDVTDLDSLVANGFPKKRWIYPLNWNQGLFDILYFKEKGDIDIIQITRAAEHRYDFSHLVPYLDKLCSTRGKCNFRFIVVIKEENVIAVKKSDF